MKTEVEVVISGRVYTTSRTLVSAVQSLIDSKGGGEETQNEINGIVRGLADYEARISVVGPPTEDLDYGKVLLTIKAKAEDLPAPNVSVEVDVHSLRRALLPFLNDDEEEDL